MKNIPADQLKGTPAQQDMLPLPTETLEVLKKGSSLFKFIQKRDGREEEFDREKITDAIFGAAQEVGGKDRRRAEDLAIKVVLCAEQSISGTPTVEQFQNIVEKVLIENGHAKTAKAFIVHRLGRAEIREKRRQVPQYVRDGVAQSKKHFPNQMAEFVYYRTYSRWIEKEARRETWFETVDRYMGYMRKKLGTKLSDSEYREVGEGILNMEAMPSMRLFWSAGEACDASHVCAYNCAYIAITKLTDFAEILYILACGTGIGFSVESQTAQALPLIKRQGGERFPVHVVEDSKEGWFRAFILGLKAWYDGKDVEFDYSKIRPYGTPLKTMGGRASGPDVLRSLLSFAREKILSRQGKRLKNIDIHDIVCKTGEMVQMGGVRRSALISLSDLDDGEMRHAKDGNILQMEKQRVAANNSAAYLEKPSSIDFLVEWAALASGRSGERGIFNRGGLKHQMPERRLKISDGHLDTFGTNPCITGDSLVAVADGRGHVSIRQLAEEGNDIPVFTFTNYGSVAVRIMRNPRLTGRSQPIHKVVLDDGSSVRVTANHKFRLASGVYKRVDQLVSGDSLAILTRYQASIKDIFHDANPRSQDYWWLNTGKATNVAEHRLIAAHHYNTIIPRGAVVHHRDRNALNNDPENLEILTKEVHDAIHAGLMVGDNNPMRRARREWGDGKWASYKQKQSANSAGAKNKRFSGFTDAEIREHALALTTEIGRRFSSKDWISRAKVYGLPQAFSKWRRDHLGGIGGLAKWAALKLGIEHIDADPRVVTYYQRLVAAGYNCDIVNGQVIILKACEVCGSAFSTERPETGVCNHSCGSRRSWGAPGVRERIVGRINAAHTMHKAALRHEQARIYSGLQFQIGRTPMKKEWAVACRSEGVSPEISRASSPFRKYEDLQDAAAGYNHKVVSVEFVGFEDVFNGTVDEFHNFFVGGFRSQTRNGKPKLVYLNNAQCGEILLRSAEFCNLTEVVCRPNDTEKSLLRKIRLATILGTYQATLTDFQHLSPDWQINCEEERLLGVSLTGQWDCDIVRNPKTYNRLKEEAVRTNRTYALRFGINPSAAITCIKPSGTVSTLVDASYGMHPRHAKYYIRRVEIDANDPIVGLLRDQKYPIRPSTNQSAGSDRKMVVEFPICAPDSPVYRDSLSAIDLLEFWKLVKHNFTEHNPSTTVSVGDDEWTKVGDWVYENWEHVGGLSFFPRMNSIHPDMPFEAISKERYEEMAARLPKIDFSELVLYEKNDRTTGAHELACASGVCETDI